MHLFWRTCDHIKYLIMGLINNIRGLSMQINYKQMSELIFCATSWFPHEENK